MEARKEDDVADDCLLVAGALDDDELIDFETEGLVLEFSIVIQHYLSFCLVEAETRNLKNGFSVLQQLLNGVRE